MDSRDVRLYEFGPFRLNPREYILVRDGQPLPIPPRAFEVLLVLLQLDGHLVTKDELLKAVWSDANVEEGNLNLAIHQARKALGDDPGAPTYIKTVPKRGYRFIGEIKALDANRPGEGQVATDVASPTGVELSPPTQADSGAGDGPRRALNRAASKSRLIAFAVVLGSGILVLLSLLLLSRLHVEPRAQTPGSGRSQISSPFDEEEAKRVVKESQFFETLRIYENPQSVNQQELAKYWVPREQGGKEITEVEAAVKRLLAKGWQYGPESRAELFEIRYSHVLTPGDEAEVGTMERWFIPMYRNDGTLVTERNVYLGPQQIDYKLRRINGVWLIQESTTPRPRKQ